MTDMRTEFEQWNLDFIEINGEEPTAEESWEACQSLNDKRIQQLLALITKKDEALIKACELIDKFSLQVYNGSDCLMVYDAVELQPADVDLVESGYLDEFDNFEKSLKPWMQEEPNVNWQPVYTIKTKGQNNGTGK